MPRRGHAQRYGIGRRELVHPVPRRGCEKSDFPSNFLSLGGVRFVWRAPYVEGPVPRVVRGSGCWGRHSGFAIYHDRVAIVSC